MVSNPKQPKIALMGGLGNQLFQLAHVCSFDRSTTWTADLRLMRPRLNSGGEVAITHTKIYHSNINLPEPFRLTQRITRPTFFLRKLVLHVLEGGYESSGRARKSVLKIGLILSAILYNHKLTYLQIESLKIGPRGKYCQELHIGFFQNQRQSEYERALIRMRSIETFDESNEENLGDHSAIGGSNALVVHFRRGDYHDHSTLGVLSSDYYSKAIYKACSERTFNEIWLFSDDLEFARSFTEEHKFGIPMLIKDSEALDAVDALDLMRLGGGFVLANSSLSWWAAALSYESNPLVLAPTTWFINNSENTPPNLKGWQTLIPQFEEKI